MIKNLQTLKIKFLFVLISVLCSCDCSRNLTDNMYSQKSTFVNNTDSLVTLSYSGAISSFCELQPRSTKSLVTSITLVYVLGVGERKTIDSLYLTNNNNRDSISIFNNRINKNETKGKGKCKYSESSTTYFINQENIDEAK